MRITNVTIEDEVLTYLQKRKLTKQFDKSLLYILKGEYKSVDLKPRKPKNRGVYYFRINKQFRAFCKIRDTTLEVFEIDNHQN